MINVIKAREKTMKYKGKIFKTILKNINFCIKNKIKDGEDTIHWPVYDDENWNAMIEIYYASLGYKIERKKRLMNEYYIISWENKDE